MTATTPGCGSTTDAKKRLAEQTTHTPHHDPAVVQLIEQARAEGAAEVWDQAVEATVEHIATSDDLRAEVKAAIKERAMDRFTSDYIADDGRAWLAGFAAAAALDTIAAALRGPR